VLRNKIIQSKPRYYYSGSHKQVTIFWEVIVSVFQSKILYMYMCPIPNVSKIVDNKEILRTVSNTGIYCSSDKVGTVYLV
jgi:predicted transport protein